MNIQAVTTSVLIVVSLGLLAACGLESAAAPSPPPAFPSGPARPAPTDAPAQNTGPNPTSVVPGNQSALAYEHPGGRFTIEYPANWQPFERENGVVFIDPGAQAGYGVFFQDTDEPYNASDLAQFATGFVLANYGQDPGFRILDRSDGLVGASIIQFRSEDEVLGPSISEATVAQFGRSIYIVVVSAVEEQWSISADALRNLTNSLQVALEPPAVTPSAEAPGPPELILYFHPSQRFGFAYASDWSLVEDQTSVEVSLPSSGFSFSAELIPHPGAGQDGTVELNEAKGWVDSLAGQYPDLERLPPAGFNLSGAEGVTIDYLYRDEAGVLWAGSVIVVAYKDELHRVVLSAPAPLWEVALEWFNLMLQGYRILEDPLPIFTPSP
ncbi:MAG: hypothetical protein ACE5H9_01815 [Anaerolineae bacterium]